jgi:hypothetical protein
MAGVVAFFGKWASLIAEMFKKYPLAAAIVTFIGVLVFIYLERERNTNKNRSGSIVHAFIVLLGWAIVVPILGTIFDAVVWFAKALRAAASFLYTSYHDHPIFVTGVVVLALISYVIWELRVKPRQPIWRAAIVIVCALTVIALALPMLEVFKGKTASAAEVPTTTSQNVSSLTKPNSTATNAVTTTSKGTTLPSAIGKK